MVEKGLVILSTGSLYDVLKSDGSIVKCKLRGRFRIQGIKSTNPVVVGDRVRFLLEENNEIGWITKIEDRKNYIVRKSTRLSKLTHIIAANIDKAFVVFTLKQPHTSLGFVDRFLTAAEAYRIPVELVFNKVDLFDDNDKIELEKLVQMYQKIGYFCHQTSAIDFTGIELLKDRLKGNISLFAGHSGTGKSALLNAINPSFNIRVGEISDYHNKGRHTTTFAQMHAFGDDTFLVDSPGIKEFGLINYEKYELSHFFLEMRPYMNQCKFHNCTHLHEPQCAVKEAVEQGVISSSRYESYLGILKGDDMDIEAWELE
ncbi:MAG: ribosome small subunit-dependent GTPase A [Bacteroidales bacterium]|nr:ribosome small subunit-dependent GTPase A [Bacteroidales bacterium]MDY0216971.1 ribosome small subunit-dependent GTPase A [Bacteroidales bacterium]